MNAESTSRTRGRGNGAAQILDQRMKNHILYIFTSVGSMESGRVTHAEREFDRRTLQARRGFPSPRDVQIHRIH